MVAAGYTMYVPIYTPHSPLFHCSCEHLFSKEEYTDMHIIILRYGSSANLVLTTGQGVNGYTLDAALGEFILTHPDVRLFHFSPLILSYGLINHVHSTLPSLFT